MVRRTDPLLPPTHELLDAYETAAGIRLSTLEWFRAFSLYKYGATIGLINKNNRKRPQPGVSVPALLDIQALMLAAARAAVA